MNGARLPQETWQQCETLLHKIEQASQHGWQLAARRVQDDLLMALDRLRNELFQLDCQLLPPVGEECQAEDYQASVVDIYADLVTLEEEFEEVSFDLRGRTMSVTTEPVELEGVYLGPFKIQLDWGDNNYRVIALDANPAVANEEVTHPHVQSEAACEGEGHLPIHNALKQGRLLDFFMIVANLLRTYNSDSPFVALSDWHGVECADCGTLVSDNERWLCEKCETNLCEACYQSCPGCDGSFCGECATRCADCEESHCCGCLKPCSGCDAEFCHNCLDKNERCTDCYDQETKKEKRLAIRDKDESNNTHAPLQPNCLGQTAISA